MNDQELYELCHSHLNYNKDTGIFTWKIHGAGRSLGKRAGSLDNRGYWALRVNYVYLRANRVAFLMTYGYLPTIVDHINGVTNDDRICNLRAATHRQNVINSKLRGGESGYRGVFKSKTRWRARIRIEGSRLNLGSFICKHEAAKAYNEAAKKYHGEFAVINTINQK